MNIRIALCLLGVLCAGPLCAQGAAPATATLGQIRLPEFPGLANKASETLTVTLDSNLLTLAKSFLDPANAEESKALKLINSLTGIYVRSYKFESDFVYPKAELDGIRRQLEAPGWSRMVGATSSKENTAVDVFMLVNGGKAQGLAIIASEPREFTIVNIVGNIDLEQLRDLEGNLGVPALGIEGGKKPPPDKTTPPKK